MHLVEMQRMSERKIKESKDSLQNKNSEGPEGDIENWKCPHVKYKHMSYKWLKEGIGNEYQNFSESWIK